MQIIHVTASLSRLGRGVSPVAWALASHQSALGENVRIAGLRDTHTREDCITQNNVPFYAASVVGPQRLGYSPSLRRHLFSDVGTCHIIHNHGLWMWPGREARQLAQKKRAKLVISPHNMLDPIYRRRSGWKKTIARLLYEDKNLRIASCLHALTEREAQCIRAFGLEEPVAIIPNGVDIAAFEHLPPEEEASKLWPELSGKKIILFLGRVHPVKGLPSLVQGWRSVAKQFRDWHLVIAGPDYDGHLADIKDYVLAAMLGGQVTFTGPVYDYRKLALLSAADIFVLPSVSEGFSMAILEALACRLPVLITPECNFPEAIEASAGEFIGTSPDTVEKGLCNLLTRSKAELMAMGNRGHRLVLENYSWRSIATRTLSVYRWLLDKGDKPECVRLD